MSYLIDSDRVAEFLKGIPSTIRLISSLPQDELAISLITYGEIYEGIYFGTDPRKHEQGFLIFLRLVRVLPLNKRIVKRFAQLRGNLRSQGQMIGQMDLLIAATALTHNLILVTGNKRHFARIPGLNLH